jgi:hypothetical protein
MAESAFIEVERGEEAVRMMGILQKTRGEAALMEKMEWFLWLYEIVQISRIVRNRTR